MENDQKKSNRTAIIVVVLVIGGFAVLFCGGLLAAIAIPAFVQFKSKAMAAEAAVNTRMIAMHAQSTFTQTCAFPPALPPTADLSTCCGGEMCATSAAPEWSSAVPVLSGPLRFSYSARPKGDTFEVVAKADFDCGGPQHTVTVIVSGSRDGDACSAEIGAMQQEAE